MSKVRTFTYGEDEVSIHPAGGVSVRSVRGGPHYQFSREGWAMLKRAIQAGELEISEKEKAPA